MDFWSHVEGGSQISSLDSASVVSFKRSSESKVRDLDVESQIEEDVFWLEISVGESSLVDVVDAFDHLTEKVSREFISKLPSFHEEVEHLSPLREFEDDVEHVFERAVGFLELALLRSLDYVQHVGVVEGRELLDLVHDLLHGFLGLGVRALALEHDLDGHGLPGFAVLTQLHLREGALSECLVDDVFVQFGCHQS